MDFNIFFFFPILFIFFIVHLAVFSEFYSKALSKKIFRSSLILSLSYFSGLPIKKLIFLFNCLKNNHFFKVFILKFKNFISKTKIYNIIHPRLVVFAPFIWFKNLFCCCSKPEDDDVKVEPHDGPSLLAYVDDLDGPIPFRYLYGPNRIMSLYEYTKYTPTYTLRRCGYYGLGGPAGTSTPEIQNEVQQINENYRILQEIQTYKYFQRLFTEEENNSELILEIDSEEE